MVKIVKSNIHKDRGILAAFLLIIILSSMVFQTGLFLNDYDKRYDRITDERHIGNGAIFYGDKDVVKEKVDNVPDIVDYDIIEAIMPSDLKFTVNDKDKENSLSYMLLFSRETYEIFDDSDFAIKDESIKENYVYLNVYTAYYNRVNVGDVLHIHLDKLGDYDLTVAGIYEDLLVGNPYSYASMIFDDKTFDSISGKADLLEEEGTEFEHIKFVNYTMKEGIDSNKGQKVISDALDDAGVQYTAYTKDISKAGYTGVLKIVSAFMTTFSVIIMAICFIMIIFTINNNIERDIRNIGALRAVGYTVAQIRTAFCAEFLMIGSIGTVIGIALAYLAFPIMDENVVRQISGMVWEKRFYPEYTFGIIAAFLLVIGVMVFLSTGKIRKLQPVTALRFGLQANSFKKNHLPLSETKGNLNILLALKSSLQAAAQNMIIFGIITAVAFVTIFSGILFYNTKIDMNNFQRILQGDSPDAYVFLDKMSQEEVQEVVNEIAAMEGVTEAYCLGSIDGTALANGNESTLLYTDNPEYVYCGVYEGEMVKEDNEAVLGSITAEKAGVTVGDEVEIKVGDKSERFLVTGLQQAVYGLGERIYITDGAAKKLGVDVNYDYIRVRVEDQSVEGVDRFLEDVKQKLGSRCTDTENHFKTSRSSDNVPVYAVSLVVMVIVVFNIIVILVVIRLLMKSIFVKKEKEFGIKKAVGFTSSQLRLQLALSLIPTCLTASIVGAVLGHILMNPLFALIFRSFGVMKADLIMKPILILITVTAVSVMVFGFSYILSGRMKRVSAYNLIQE